jgi:uncharacterized repeat protein (TIGR01451 family)
LSQIGNYLHYIIRFQNTGTADAVNVVISDAILSKLNPSSIQIEDTSHPYRYQVTNNKLEVYFDGINLPASLVNEPGSHGYVAFKIKPNSNVVLNDDIQNTAKIYFDYNLPIVTNTTATTVVALTTQNFDLDSNFIISPNPVKNELKISANSNLKVNSISIYNTLGQLVKTIPNQIQPTLSLDVSELNNGTYFLSIQTEKGKMTQKFIKL